MTSTFPILQSIVEDEIFLDSLSSMASKTHASASVQDSYSMAFNVRLAFADTNAQEDQLYKDPMM